jgi:beta-lactamase class A
VASQYQYYRPAAKNKKVKKRRPLPIVLVVIVSVVTFSILFFVNNGKQTKVASIHAATTSTVTKATLAPTTTVQATAASSTLSNTLKASWAAIAKTNPGDIDIAVYDNKTGDTVEYSDAAGTMNTASIVKLSIAEEVMLQSQKQGIPLTSDQQTDMQNMIEISDNDSASDLWNEVGGSATMDNFFGTIGATSTTAGTDGMWGLTQTTATDQLKVLNALAYPSSTFLSNSSVSTIDGLLDNVDSSQDWGVSGGIPSDVTVELKNGWLEDNETTDAYSNTDSWVVNSIGHVYGEGADYTIAVLTDGQTTEQSGIDVIEDLSTATWNDVS